MAGASNPQFCGCEGTWQPAGGRRVRLPPVVMSARCVGGRMEVGISRTLGFPQGERQHLAELFLHHPRKGSSARNVCITRMTLVEEKPVLDKSAAIRPKILSYDLVQGALAKSEYITYKSAPAPPTCVLLHGILGCRKNWGDDQMGIQTTKAYFSRNFIIRDMGRLKYFMGIEFTYDKGSFARRLAQEFPTWQFLLVDLRCHGESASIQKHGSHTVASAALDVLKLVGQLKLIPRVLVGHSFGGKVALSMVEQAAKPLARPVNVWVLDATPGKVRPGGHGEDRPAELISFLSRMPKEVASKREVVHALVQEGFSLDVAQWVVTNLRRTMHSGSSTSGFSWAFDLKGISEMYKSYEETNLWEIVEDVPQGVHINFLKAERSLHRWALEDLQRIHAAEELAAEEGAGVQMHVLEDAGHWVQADNPDDLFKILSTSFHGF